MDDAKRVGGYLERSGILPTRRNPLPRIEPDTLPVHAQALHAPLPAPEIVADVNGVPSPDRGVTQVWPPTAS